MSLFTFVFLTTAFTTLQITKNNKLRILQVINISQHLHLLLKLISKLILVSNSAATNGTAEWT